MKWRALARKICVSSANCVTSLGIRPSVFSLIHSFTTAELFSALKSTWRDTRPKLMRAEVLNCGWRLRPCCSHTELATVSGRTES